MKPPTGGFPVVAAVLNGFFFKGRSILWEPLVIFFLFSFTEVPFMNLIACARPFIWRSSTAER